MNWRLILVALVFLLPQLLLFSLPGRAADSHYQGLDAPLETWIKRHTAETRGQEYPEFRKSASGDLNADGTEDFAVVYTLEGVRGGTDWLRFLAVFLRQGQKVIYLDHLLVGGKGIRGANAVRIEDQVIKLNIREYQVTDALCCPSKPGIARFILKGGQLVELKHE